MQNETYVCIDNEDFSFMDVTDNSKKTRVFHRTISKNVKVR